LLRRALRRLLRCRAHGKQQNGAQPSCETVPTYRLVHFFPQDKKLIAASERTSGPKSPAQRVVFSLC
jgi:hypothetical protein